MADATGSCRWSGRRNQAASLTASFWVTLTLLPFFGCAPTGIKNAVQYGGKEIMPGVKVMLVIAKITAKGQTTIPQDVRTALKVVPGDRIAWEIGPDGTATVRRVQPMDMEYLRAIEGTLGEWAGAADEEAYRGL